MKTFLDYIDLYFPALGIVFLAITGGVVAHIKDWEASHPNMTWRQHVWALIRRGIMAALAGLIWYYVSKQWAWQGQPFAYAGASVVGLFAPEFFDLMWTIVRERLLMRTGVRSVYMTQKAPEAPEAPDAPIPDDRVPDPVAVPKSG